MLNKVMLIGRLGRDPEVRKLDNGATVAKFSLATDESYKDKEGNTVQQTEWHHIIVWRALAEIAEKFLKKGMLVYVDGKLTHREYTDKDNQKKYFTEVVANNFKMLERKDDTKGGYFPASEPGADGGEKEPVMDDNVEDPAGDLPF